MKKLLFVVVIAGLSFHANAQKISISKVPDEVKIAFAKTYPNVKQAVWEKENGNFEGNWKVERYGHSAMFTLNGKFAGSETDIDPAKLPMAAREYVKKHAHSKIKEASLNEDAKGNKTYEADVKGKANIFDLKGHFIKIGEED